MKTSEVLNKAADLIEERGWAGIETDLDVIDPWDHAGDGTGPLCLEGGILAAVGGMYAGDLLLLKCPAARAVHEHLELPRRRPLWEWNDDRGRTAEEVIEVLRAAAVIEASREEAVEKVSA